MLLLKKLSIWPLTTLFAGIICFMSSCDSTTQKADTHEQKSITGEEFSQSDSLNALNTAFKNRFEQALHFNPDVESSYQYAPEPKLEDSACPGIPLERKDLKSGIATYYKTYNNSTTAKVGVNLPWFSISGQLKKDELVQVIHYIEKKNVPCRLNGHDTTLVYGIGFSLYLHITKLQRGIGASDLTKMAASVQLDNSKSQVEYVFVTHGISGPIVSKLIFPSLVRNFDVEGYGRLAKNVDNLGVLLSDTNVQKYVYFTPDIITDINP